MRHLLPLVAITALGCLPDELRDPPAEVLITVEPSQATREGLETTSGWQVTFDQVALNVGRVGFPDDEDCTYYSFTQYSWLMDMTEADREKVGLVHALGDCRLSVDMPVLDPDVTQYGPGADARLEDEMAYSLSLRIEGRAQRGGSSVPFRVVSPAYVPLGPCLESMDSERLATTTLASGQSYEVPLLVSAEAIFGTARSTEPIFDFSRADRDDDGEVTAQEFAVELTELGDLTIEVSGYELNAIGNLLRLRDGGPCLIRPPDDSPFSPF